MKKTRYLYLLRHAKSSWDNLSIEDWARPLNDRGHRDAPLMAQRLSRQTVLPDLIVSSPAVRAFTTALEMSRALKYPEEDILIRRSIYEASVATLLGVVRKTDDKVTCLMLVGHNPGFTDLVNTLSDRELYNLPTCAWVRIKIPDAEWENLGQTAGQWDGFDKPKLAKKE